MFKRTHRSWRMSIIPAMLIAANAVAQTHLPLALDLPTALQLADEHNPVLLEVRERIREQDGVLTVSLSSRLPDIHAFGSYQWEQDSRSGSFGGPTAPDDESWRVGAELIQPLYSGGILNAAVRTRKYQSLALEAQVAATRNQVLTDVFRKYYRALLAHETIRVQTESLELMGQQLALASNRYAAGAVSRFDVLQAEVRLANARPPLIRAVNHYITAIEDLRTSLGVTYLEGNGPTNISLTGKWETESTPTTLDHALAVAREMRPELVAVDMNIEAARAWTERMKRQRAPRVNFFANYCV